MSLSLRSAVAAFGAAATSKPTSPAASGEPEDQLRAPLEVFVHDLAELCGFSRNSITSVGESPLTSLKTRPDYAISVENALVGFIEIKAPGKGADPERFKDPHDRSQWRKLRSLPNLIYTDGNEFSLWRNGESVGSIVRLIGDVETSGAELDAPADLPALFEDFLRWRPVAPRDPKQLAVVTARLCRLLRDEAVEQMERRSPALTALAVDWRKLLFPDASDAQFADGYAQAVTFGLLVARAKDIHLDGGLDQVALQLGQTNSLIGAALRLLTDDAENQAALKTSLGTLTRVLDVVDWPTVGKGDPEAWLYFYEDFLEVYDNELRKRTGSYYTPPQVVQAMTRLVDEALRSPTRFNLPGGLASELVAIADPAVGAGTFLLGIMKRIAAAVERDEGPGAVPAAISSALNRIVGFEIQLGPFAVAQLRLLAETAQLIGAVPHAPLRLFVTDTLGNPYIEHEWIPTILKPISESRRRANEIKREEPITVVIGNPPYREKAKGMGGWVESGSANSPEPAPLSAWSPPPDWGVSAHAKHLRNLYVYFWRWATWKVFDHHPSANNGLVCFITVAGFLNGPGFERMRDYLRRTADEVWVIDCSPEGHQPEARTRIFEDVQQPVCITLASRSPRTDSDKPAVIRYRALAKGPRKAKFAELAGITLDGPGWIRCPSDWRSPFLPVSKGAWATYPALDDLFIYNGSGVMPGRTWIIAPDAESLHRRWKALIDAPEDKKEELFHPHLRNGNPGDKHSKRVVLKGLPGHESRAAPIADDKGSCITPIRYGFRSFDRQWIIPDNRLINQPNPELWANHSERQVYLTAPSDRSPTAGPALTFTALIPDLHHYNGRGGRAFPLWRDREAREPNVSSTLLRRLRKRYGRLVTGEDVMAYIAAVAAHPAFTERFSPDLIKPGLRIPITADPGMFAEAVELGSKVIWLHTFGERFVAPDYGRPAGPPRLPTERRPRVPAAGALPSEPEIMPDSIDYDAAHARLRVGQGHIEPVSARVWEYEISGKRVLRQWFSYRKARRERPLIGKRRAPSPLGEIQPDHWLSEYTTELLNVINALEMLVELEPLQADLLDRICAGPTISFEKLRSPGTIRKPKISFRKTRGSRSCETLALFG